MELSRKVPSIGARLDTATMLVGTARCAVTARVQRAERTLEDARVTAHFAARTAQRAIPAMVAVSGRAPLIVLS